MRLRDVTRTYARTHVHTHARTHVTPLASLAPLPAWHTPLHFPLLLPAGGVELSDWYVKVSTSKKKCEKVWRIEKDSLSLHRKPKKMIMKQKITKKERLSGYMYVMSCPKCGRIVASAAQRDWLPEFTYCDKCIY